VEFALFHSPSVYDVEMAATFLENFFVAVCKYGIV
jgi:hypothetical protein